jgi:hypothetical protein
MTARDGNSPLKLIERIRRQVRLLEAHSLDPASLLRNRRVRRTTTDRIDVEGKRNAHVRRPPRSFLRWRKRHASTNIAAGPRAATLLAGRGLAGMLIPDEPRCGAEFRGAGCGIQCDDNR